MSGARRLLTAREVIELKRDDAADLYTPGHRFEFGFVKTAINTAVAAAMVLWALHAPMKSIRLDQYAKGSNCLAFLVAQHSRSRFSRCCWLARRASLLGEQRICVLCPIG